MKWSGRRKENLVKRKAPYSKTILQVFFKSYKSYLKLAKECRSISYDALNAHIAIVFTIYMMLSVVKRRNEDDKTTEAQLEEFTSSFIGHLPKYMQDALSDAQSAAWKLFCVLKYWVFKEQSHFSYGKFELFHLTANLIVKEPLTILARGSCYTAILFLHWL